MGLKKVDEAATDGFWWGVRLSVASAYERLREGVKEPVPAGMEVIGVRTRMVK